MRTFWFAAVTLGGCTGGGVWGSKGDLVVSSRPDPVAVFHAGSLDDSRSETFLADGESDAFYLRDRPDLSTLEVLLPDDTLAVDDGVAYDEVGNAILLDEPPAEGTEVTVEYVLLDPSSPAR